MNRLRRLALLALATMTLGLGVGCTTTSALLSVAGVSTDTSVTWEVVKYFHAQMTEGDPRPCAMLNSVQRALSGRCGEFVPGSIVAADIGRTGLSECVLTLAVRDPRLWPAVPDLMQKGAYTEKCSQSPLVELAQREPCPDFSTASADTLRSLVRLGETDPRAVHHDAMRMLSCPSARTAGLDRVIATWRARGQLRPGMTGFSPLGALHPDALSSPLARDLEADGHTARAALGGYQGELRPGFEEALRTSQWAALEWWFQRVPELSQRVPPTQGNQLPWIPLARVLLPKFLAYPESQKDMIGFLVARGADPHQRLPSNPDQTVIDFAKVLKSPMLAVLDAPPVRIEPERFAVAPKTAQASE